MAENEQILGEYIKQLAEEQNLKPSGLGKEINKTKQNVTDIYKRTAIDSDLLLSISKALAKNVFAYFDDKEPIASFKKAELDEWNSKIEKLHAEIENLQTVDRLQDERIQDLLKRIADQEEIAVLQRKYIGELEAKMARLENK